MTESGLVVDLAKTVSPIETDPQTIRNAIGLFPYLKATGSSVVEDYRRILSISEKYNDIVGFIAECGMQSIKQSPEFVELQRKIDAMKADIKAVKDGNQKAKKTQELKRIESTIQAMSQSQISGVDKWLLNGIKLWITTFMPTRINFRVYPFSTCPSFQVLCNLKRDCFVDQDPEHLLYGYGNRPNVPLTVFGLLTSIPMPKEAASFDPMAEFEGTPNESSEQIAFEKGFRGIFGAMDNIEALMRFSRYPNVTVHPIAVYRSFVPMSS